MILLTLLFGTVWLILLLAAASHPTHNPLRHLYQLRLFLLPLLLLSLSGSSGCNVGDVGSSTTSSAVDNSVDNSQHGISSCTQGSTLVCSEVGPGQYEQTEECTNVDGSPVVLQGPEEIDENIFNACSQVEDAVVETLVPVETFATTTVYPTGTAIPSIPE